MANCAYYELRVYGNKGGVERFLKTIRGLDDEYMFCAFDQSDSYNQLCACSHGRYSMDFFGEVKWGSRHLSVKSCNIIDYDTGKKIITWLTASELFGLTMEWYCEECGSSFNEYYSVSNGVNLRSDVVYWSYPGIFDNKCHCRNKVDFERQVVVASEKGIPLDMSQVDAIRTNDYRGLEELDCFSFGGYNWDKHSEGEIIRRVPPRVCRDIRRF